MTFEASRKKQLLVLQPRGKALYEDDSSFGSKMLAKMGWSKGKGLGKEQHGNLDFIQIRYKNNANGLGYDGLKDNQWTENESQFDSLLKSLNGNCSNPESAEEQPTGSKSLEEKSKSSRARVHYKKFTRGKDVHKYSEKDLANILGKKSLNDVEVPQEVKETELLNEKSDVYQSNLIVNAGLTVTDYFKLKMKSKNGSTARTQGENGNNPDKKKKRKQSDDQEEETSHKNIDQDSTETSKKARKLSNTEEPKKKKKKSKIVSIEDERAGETFPQDEPPKKIKSKKQAKLLEPVKCPDENFLQKAVNVDENPPLPLPIKKTSSEPEKLSGANAVYSTNIIQIASHVAQKMSCMVVDNFKNANIANIVGYGLSEEIDLKVVQTKVGENFSITDKYSLYNMDRLTTKQKVNPRKVMSKLKRTKKSIQVI